MPLIIILTLEHKIRRKVARRRSEFDRLFVVALVLIIYLDTQP
jgi:hypothetical protein